MKDDYSLEQALENRKQLEETTYGNLKQKLEEMGVGEIWKAGKKKEDLIKSALQAIELKYKTVVVEGELVNDPELEKSKKEDQAEQEIAKAALAKTIEDAIVEDEDTDEDEDAESKIDEEILNHTFSREQIQTNLDICMCNLRQAVPIQKKLIFEKIHKLELMTKVLDSRKE